MKIDKVKTAVKIGSFRKTASGLKLIEIDYVVDNSILKDESPRVYIFTSDDVIMKIGGSMAKGGIKGTMGPYLSSQQDSPSASRYITHRLIREELDKDRAVDVYMINSTKVKAKVNGLFGSYEVAIAAFKEMEDACKQDYFKLEQKYPVWNFQENNEIYPEKHAKAWNAHHEKRLKK